MKGGIWYLGKFSFQDWLGGIAQKGPQLRGLRRGNERLLNKPLGL